MKTSASKGDPAVSAIGLVKSLGGKRVVDGIDLLCWPGEVLGLLGPNGAGKTTALRLCYGFLRPDAGSIRIAGFELDRDGDAARRALGVCTQDDTYDSDFTVRGNLLQTGRYYRPRIAELKERVEALLQRFGLEAFADQKPETLSGGYKRRLMIARSVLHRPKVVFLDEPTTGLDPQARMAVWELVNGLRADGMAVVLTTHYMDEAERLSDRLLILKSGRVRAEGSPRQVLGDVVGEHIVVLSSHRIETEGALAWLRWRGARPAQVLADWHVALDAAGLSAFAAEFPELHFEVRKAALDDLFHALASEKSL